MLLAQQLAQGGRLCQCGALWLYAPYIWHSLVGIAGISSGAVVRHAV